MRRKGQMGVEDKLSRKMVFPYTFTAKIVQFPHKLHFQHHWMYPWFIGAAILSMPLFYKIQQAANCEANIKIWAEKRRLEEEHHKHKWD
ncbi:uncharacterized protein LOC126907155 isoform X2 [Daktulosphaira vitifoliae]|uniref:uncharacterized protein LOC126907155 isoform X2 n=1 Tax=Daktulosphaira vitifoliae TaxID=58002 RepID=UPI0021AAD4AC|nr:uncharacterized protein LOC126907155 isoform X2 [Daktulosphaira vitifoliae]